MNQRSNAAFIAVIYMLALVATLPVQAPARETFTTTTGSCLAVTLNPPGVDAGECNTFSSFEADAIIQGSDVEVSWTFPGNRTNVTEFQVYRGPLPDMMELVDETDPLAASYVDTYAAESGQAVWYRVVAVYENGTAQQTPAALVSASPVTVSTATGS